MRSELKLISRVLFPLCLLIMLSNCRSVQQNTVPTLPEKASDNLSRLEKIAQNHPEKSVRAEAHLSHARIFSSFRNPDYRRALKELEMYLSLEPEGKTDDILSWLAVLRELDKTKQKVGELKEIVERLKDLDIKMEEKRKQTK